MQEKGWAKNQQVEKRTAATKKQGKERQRLHREPGGQKRGGLLRETRKTRHAWRSRGMKDKDSAQNLGCIENQKRRGLCRELNGRKGEVWLEN